MMDNPKTLSVQVCVPTAIQPRKSGHHDGGGWLLGGAEVRKRGWARLQTLSEEIALLRTGPDLAYTSTKLLLDIVAAASLLVMLMPLLLVVAIAVAWESPGPVFFRQFRVGKDGRPFVIWKFRSMRADAPVYARSPVSGDDERLTRVGRVIRRLSLDELPQLLNVLRGEMSLVGPRPEMPFIADRYDATQRQRLVVKPGITGLWQISHGRASAIHENLQYDLYYIREQNLRLDVAILLRTLSVVVRGADVV